MTDSRNLSDLISYKRAILNGILALAFAIILPYVAFLLLDPSSTFFYRELVLLNGILFLIIYVTYGLFKKGSFLKLLIGMSYVISVIYFFTVGNNIFTAFLPHCSFAELCLEGDILGFSIRASFNYFWIAIMTIILKFLKVIRSYVKPEKEKKKAKEKKEKKLRIIHF